MLEDCASRLSMIVYFYNFRFFEIFHSHASVSTLNKNRLTSFDATIVKLLFYDDESSDLVTNILVFNASILSSERFDGPLI